MKAQDFNIGDTFRVKGRTYPSRKFCVRNIRKDYIVCIDLNEHCARDAGRTLYTLSDVNLVHYYKQGELEMLHREPQPKPVDMQEVAPCL